MKILVTGAAGFIGFHCVKRLAALGHELLGIDNLNDYYDPMLKLARLQQLQAIKSFRFIKMDLADRTAISNLFEANKFDVVLHLGAQAGVRYSIDKPFAYLDSNLTGMLTILEGCRHSAVNHLVYASSSSVYGANIKLPFSTDDRVDSPVSLYAATKKANELMAHTYAHLYGIPTTGLRFFTVYGPWGRPDMAYYKFADAIMSGKPIDIYNHGNMMRDFTYIDDIVSCVETIVGEPVGLSSAGPPHRVYNLGHNHPEQLMELVSLLEQKLGREADKRLLPMQPGDVCSTFADIRATSRDFNWAPKTELREGIRKFVEWYLPYRKARISPVLDTRLDVATASSLEAGFASTG